MPPNTAATVYVPENDAAAVTEGCKPAARADVVRFLRMDAGSAVFSVRLGDLLVPIAEVRCWINTESPGQVPRHNPALSLRSTWGNHEERNLVWSDRHEDRWADVEVARERLDMLPIQLAPARQNFGKG